MRLVIQKLQELLRHVIVSISFVAVDDTFVLIARVGRKEIESTDSNSLSKIPEELLGCTEIGLVDGYCH